MRVNLKTTHRLTTFEHVSDLGVNQAGLFFLLNGEKQPIVMVPLASLEYVEIPAHDTGVVLATIQPPVAPMLKLSELEKG